MLDSISVKPLLYVIAALGLLLVLTNVGWGLHASALDLQRDVAVANKDSALALADALKVERDAWKNKAGELKVANLASQKTVDHLKAELELAQGEKRRLQAEGQEAVAAAQAEANDADHALRDFINRYAQQLRNADCAGALSVVQQSCPALEGY
ncbi:hypothetical protein [Lysobacter enzymogenes]|uniref:hypothetical protein n=1 Tax=Lysobacter enzymogenes TaxID=69 RepID=UPI001116BB44|nr:hypothetical protein [Lysobacter enzymogenes]UZW62755.1 hypothetical protein BV903_010875 [Lysobacter enzymogenes]